MKDLTQRKKRCSDASIPNQCTKPAISRCTKQQGTYKNKIKKIYPELGKRSHPEEEYSLHL